MGTAFIRFNRFDVDIGYVVLVSLNPRVVLARALHLGVAGTDALVHSVGNWVNRGLLPRIPSPPAIPLEVICDLVGRLGHYGRV